MSNASSSAPTGHNHVFLGKGHERNERRAWFVIALCSAMMVIEIVGGLMFGSIALVADGLHMSTHAGALLLAGLAYTFARRYSADRRFTFGTGKLGDLAGFASAVVLAMIALLIGYEAMSRLFAPVPIHFAQAIPIASLGLIVNLASAWLLSGSATIMAIIIMAAARTKLSTSTTPTRATSPSARGSSTWRSSRPAFRPAFGRTLVGLCQR